MVEPGWGVCGLSGTCSQSAAPFSPSAAHLQGWRDFDLVRGTGCCYGCGWPSEHAHLRPGVVFCPQSRACS